ncbi:Penicillin-binding protein 1A [Rickettsiales endosymbiont of Paramecium tredecaurelia]|uniref:penicillin-binding protein 1A n=1 Tax=Candidatus Sarmatiella mevalonica TaxID=2770581 RepID=UPI001924EF8C|nr:PBP1A family penicillin-binding protein [Candidatus Sarmatiella mevalonica]MBL3284212.1 Penicillin-binding protein 1A [Candidatus Sarmatiella mevalonica]
MFKVFAFCLKCLAVASTLGAALFAVLFFYYSKDLPNYSELENYYPPCVTRIYSYDGKLLEEYATEHRIFVPFKLIPKSLVDAFVSAEDKNFFQHQGLDLVSTTRAAINSIINLLQNKRVEGGSSITQQVVKNFLLGNERSISRKIKEAILSYRVSQIFSKERVLELYLNQIFLGKGYGVVAAAQAYFNKSLDELTIEESALLAALPKAPSSVNPEKNYNRAKIRRDYVINRMLEDGYITTQAAQKAIDTPIVLTKRPKTETVSAHYYAEHVRNEAIKIVGKENFYNDGLFIVTCLDSVIQENAKNALRKGIEDYDRSKGFRGSSGKVTDLKNAQQELNNFTQQNPLPPGYEWACVMEVQDKNAKILSVSAAEHSLNIKDANWAKSNLTSIKQILNICDIIAVTHQDGRVLLTQKPKINGGIIVINPTDGKVLAMQGGYDFEENKFNRVTQAMRQPGSTIKPFVYLAALEDGIEQTKIFSDGPIDIYQGPGLPIWRPKNYRNNFLGQITMRTGLERSRNLVTVRVAKEVGLEHIVSLIKRLEIHPNPTQRYSVVLGALETTLEKMSCAYAALANDGCKVNLHFIEMIKDRNGRVLYRRDTRAGKKFAITDNQDTPPDIPPVQTQRLIDSATNYQLVSMLTGVVQRGTARKALCLGKTIAGKTGTTNDSKDVWFMGFTPYVVVGTYMGFDQPKSLGQSATGGSVALPVFIEFMQQSYASVGSIEFVVPSDIAFKEVHGIQEPMRKFLNNMHHNDDIFNKIDKKNDKDNYNGIIY